MNRKVLITGAAGFIGSNLADELLKLDWRVMGIDNFDPFYGRDSKEANVADAKKNYKYQFKEGDIRDPDFIEKCFSSFNPDIIVHLAAKAGVRPSIKDPKAYYDVNVGGTLNLLEKMKEKKISKLIFASSSSVYGNNEKVPFSETDNVDYPISPYAATKKAGELLCHTFHHLYNIDVFCLRFFTVYGHRQRPDLAIHKFTKAILAGQEVPFFGDGTSSRDYTYIDDIIQGITGAINKVKGFEIINLGDSKTVSLSNLVKLLEKHTGRLANIKPLPMQEGDVTRTYADISKAGTLLHYEPTTDIETGIGKYVKWFRESYAG